LAIVLVGLGIMSRIATGFDIKPLVGSIDEDQLLGRYFPTKRFVSFAEHKALWFTRTYKWKDGDVCEASLLPAYRRHIQRENLDKDALFYLRALMEFELHGNLGCCFSMLDSDENELMWHRYAPAPDFGVLVLFRAKTISDAMACATPDIKKRYLHRVYYLTDEKAARMTVKDCKHSRVNGRRFDWSVNESHYYKRTAFSSEHEVRATLSSQITFGHALETFARKEDIQPQSIYAKPPADQKYYSIAGRSSMQVVTPQDCQVFLNEEQARRFAEMCGPGAGEYFETYAAQPDGPGMYLRIDMGAIEKIILHPGFVSGSSARTAVLASVEKAGIGCPVVDSLLYTKEW
jgi:hypothetical protein